MWKRLRWQYSQWKLLFYPLSPLIHWLLRGIFEEWLFDYLTKYVGGRVEWLMGIITWAELHPNLSTGILVVIIGSVVAVLAIRDARKRLNRIYEIADILLKMFNLALGMAKAKAQTINLDARYAAVMNEIIKDVAGIDATTYVGKDMKDRGEIAKIDRKARKVAPTDEEYWSVLKLIASAMVNNGYGIEEKELKENNKEYDKSKQRLETLRKVPSNQINDAINKCLNYIYILSNIYIYHSSRIKKRERLSQQTLAEMRNFIRDQENNTGDMSKCLTELRIEINKFTKGDRSAKPNQV